MTRSTSILYLLILLFACSLTAQDSQSYYNNYAPHLLQPLPGSTLDNGCTNAADVMTWDFQWSAVYGAQGYQLMIMSPNSAEPFENIFLEYNSYQLQLPNYYIYDQNLSGWTWYVRVYANNAYGAWSTAGYFSVEPVNTDCGGANQYYLPTATVPLSSPELVSPIYNAVVPNKSWEGEGDYYWFFDWKHMDGAEYYELEIINPYGNSEATLRTTVSDLRYYLHFPMNQQAQEWYWRVRAFGNGQWSPWSEKATFTLERSGTVTCN